MKALSISGLIIIAVLFSVSCRQSPESSLPYSPLPTAVDQATFTESPPTLPPNIQPTPTQAPSPLLEQTTSPSAGENGFAAYRGRSSYPNSPLFEINYDEEVWEPGVSDLPGHTAALLVKENPACYLVLQEGPREYRNIGPIQLAGQPWMLRQAFPEYLIYGTIIERDAFIFGLHLPEAYSNGQHSECQKLAETVLATIHIVGPRIVGP
ncbi:MAG: hypothetical protein H6642_03575 [Caldilineaceae bacterium]|nr:hypothetical protein [Caldilineaceae bacterium]